MDRKAYYRQWRKDHPGRNAESCRKWQANHPENENGKAWRIANPERVRVSKRKWTAANPEKVKAHNVLNDRIERGKIKRGPCEVCGTPKAHAHHSDYSKPLDVTWLCNLHHRQKHTKP